MLNKGGHFFFQKNRETNKQFFNSGILKNSKGQLTIFIIIIVFIIGIAIVFFALRSQIGKKEVVTPEIEPIKYFVENCIEEAGNEIVYSVGQGGGYLFPPEFSTASGIPYYYSNGKNYMPSKNQMESEISTFVNLKIFFCTKNFIDFPEFEIEQGEPKTETKILDDKIILNVNYPLSIKMGLSTSLIKEFNNIEIPVRFGIIYDSIDKIIKEQLSHESICLSCILDISLKNDLFVNMLDYDEETTIFIVRDENSQINKKPFEFIFSNKYKLK